MSTTVTGPNTRFHPEDNERLDMFADLVPNTVESLDFGPGYGTAVFEGDLTQRQQYLVKRRMAQQPKEEQREEQIVSAYQALNDFIATPNAQITPAILAQQTKLHARVLRALVRNHYGDAGGTLGEEPTT